LKRYHSIQTDTFTFLPVIYFTKKSCLYAWLILSLFVGVILTVTFSWCAHIYQLVSGIDIHKRLPAISDNTQAIKAAQLIIVSVGSQDVENLLNVIKDDLDPKKHILVSSKDQVKLLGCNNF